MSDAHVTAPAAPGRPMHEHAPSPDAAQDDDDRPRADPDRPQSERVRFAEPSSAASGDSEGVPLSRTRVPPSPAMPPLSLPLHSQYLDVLDISWHANLRYDARLGDDDGDEPPYGSYHGPRDAPHLRHVRIETLLGPRGFPRSLFAQRHRAAPYWPAALFDPPADPFISVLQRELIFALFMTIGWAWSAFGIFFAHLARHHTDYNVTLTEVLSGQYIETGPTVICAVWKGPGPYAFPSVFGTITIDISFVTAVLFPYPYYTIGKVVVLPLVLHASLCILASATIFASTIIAQYASALARSLELVLESAIREHRSIFKLSPSGSDFSATAKKISRLVTRAGGGLGLAAAAPRLVKSDIAFGRFAPSDVGRVQEFGRGLIVRANGLDIFPLIDLTRERFPVTPLPSNPPVSSRRQSSHPGTTAIGRASVVIEMIDAIISLEENKGRLHWRFQRLYK
ncbi:uncharacterized protein C8Q71DRAFT_908525 [Rhodofomes roseus]|uniref:Putative ER transporter 6TM N-terminal domain-containing protein n=1 Tax=Rhodofomes roseus TaxID=34475 RepID=A0ABQ8KE32_9APHY|nr:uncharacterized protein C8Q71DRAFT_908525 [Rhodofomes roseus]KAH9835384.1 hypothetical protein C8Q71DRAFT_908525 [Rhodofomes roseus]